MRDFREKTILITGSSSGIGLSLLEYFFSLNAKVISVSLTEPKIRFDGIQYIITDIKNIEYILSQVKNENRTIDILINNAGVIFSKPLLECQIDDINKTFSTNFTYNVLLTRAIVEFMIRNKTEGVIINNISFAAKMPSINTGLYAASKAALYSITKSFAAELAPYHIRVNGFSPGVLLTKMTKEVIEGKKSELLKNISMKKIGTPRDVNEVVGFLASDDSKYLNGTNIDVSGGKFIVQNAYEAWKRMEEKDE